MRIVLQRVRNAHVTVNAERVGAIGVGVVLLVGLEPEDDGNTVQRVAAQIAKLRIFEDERGRMNRSLLQVGAEVLLISQFTLAASLGKGNRPSFHTAAAPAQAEELCNRLVDALRAEGLTVATGRFGASMQVALINDGPVTFVIESR